MLAVLLGLGGCASQPAVTLPDPALVARHEWDHGPPWGPEEQPWVAPPAILAYAPGYAYGPGFWGPGYWGSSVGIGVGIGLGRGTWWRGYRGVYGGHRGGWGGPRHFGGHRGRR